MIEGLGERIRERRKQLKMSMKELAEISGVSASYIGNIESEESYPNSKKLVEIARCLDVPVAWLLGESMSELNNDMFTNIKKSDAIYKLFLDTHVFPNGMTYAEMEKKLKKLETMQKILGDK